MLTDFYKFKVDANENNIKDYFKLLIWVVFFFFPRVGTIKISLPLWAITLGYVQTPRVTTLIKRCLTDKITSATDFHI